MVGEPEYLTDERRWRAVAERDRGADGLFFYAVRSTGVYCRPGCSSRRPKRANVEFFDTSEAAENAGYRPCRRCRPEEASPETRRRQMVVEACRLLERAEEPLKLTDLAGKSGLSPWHFHRLFKKELGVTPKQYAASLRAKRFCGGLESGRSVTEAIYEAGYGSSSRAYENDGGRLAMTPSEYKKGAAGATIRHGSLECSLGWVLVAATDRGVCAIEFGDDAEYLAEQLGKKFPQARFEPAGPDFMDVVRAVVDFIEEPGTGIGLPLDIWGTAFQERVWAELRKIQPGETKSYAEIAQRIGNPQAARAVARACAANKLAVAVPCHRVVRGDGKPGGYRWGVERKRRLLAREKERAEEAGKVRRIDGEE